jgi:hypothetical protein
MMVLMISELERICLVSNFVEAMTGYKCHESMQKIKITQYIKPLIYIFQGSDGKWCKLWESVKSRKCKTVLFQCLSLLNRAIHVDELPMNLFIFNSLKLTTYTFNALKLKIHTAL